MTETTITLDDLIRTHSGISDDFDPEAEASGSSLVQPWRKTAREFQLTVLAARQAGETSLRQVAGSADLNEQAKARIRREELGKVRSVIATANRELIEASARFHDSANQLAVDSIRPKSVLPPLPSGALGETDRALLENVRASARVSEEVARRLAESRADSIVDRAIASDPDKAGVGLLEAYQAVKRSGDATLLYSFERIALERPLPQGQRAALAMEIRDAQVARVPEPVARLAVWATFFSPLDAWREGIVAESANDHFFEGKGLQPHRFAQVVGEPLSKFLGFEK